MRNQIDWHKTGSETPLLSILASLFCLALVSGNLLGCGNNPQGTAQQKRVLKLSHGHPPEFSSEIHTAAWIFQQWVNDHSDSLEVRIYASNQLGEEREVYEAMQLGGGADCTITGTAILNNFSPQMGVLDLPFLWNDYDHVHRVLDGEVGRELAQDLEELGLVVLAWMDSWGYRNVVSAEKPLNGPQDLEGLKIRTIQTPTYIAALGAMGANATPMAFGEVYTSMQTGVIDGFEHSASVVLASKFYEVGQHIALTRHLFGPLVFCFSKQSWQSLPDAEKVILKDGARMARDVQRSLAPLREEEALEQLQEKGMVLHEFDTTSFREKAKSLQDGFAVERGAEPLLERIREAE